MKEIEGLSAKNSEDGVAEAIHDIQVEGTSPVSFSVFTVHQAGLKPATKDG